jgi:hypothetical protein
MANIMPQGMDNPPRSIGSKVLVCPGCKIARSCPSGTLGIICSNCNTYFSESESLSADEAEGGIGHRVERMSEQGVKLRDGIYAQAEQYAKDTERKRRDGTQRHHEPGGGKRNW